MPRRSDGRSVPAALASLPRLIAVVAAGLLVSATISLAAGTPATPRVMKSAPARQHVLVVPDVRRQVFVFAKGMLEDNGFGWHVKGSVHGFAANVVVSQSPRPGARVLDTGTPKIALQLARGKARELGTPEDVSPYGASLIPVGDAHQGDRGDEGGGGRRREGPRRLPASGRRHSPCRGAPREPLEPAVAAQPRRSRSRKVARAPGAHRREQPSLAGRALLDRDRREVRLVGRRPVARDADPGRPARRAPLARRVAQPRPRPAGAARGSLQVDVTCPRGFAHGSLRRRD